ncbi:MAG: hypothetical protein ACTSU2_02005 [Promethearchaeota archaeon]
MAILESAIVTRTINVDFIYLDIIFLTIWISFLIYKRYKIPIGWGLFGAATYIFVDYILWHLIMHSRTYSGPVNELVFFLWFCFSPGFVQFSYVAVMFEKRNFHELIFWTLLFYIGWTSVALGSQLIPWDDRIIVVARNMNAGRQRIIDTIMTLGNVAIAFILYKKKKISLDQAIYLFIVGTLVEFSLEFSLTVSGIRIQQGTWSIGQMVVNALIEFNLGIVLMYLLWLPIQKRKFGIIFKSLPLKDIKNIKTNYNIIASIAQEGDFEKALDKLHSNKYFMQEVRRLYGEEKIKLDLQYFLENN